MADNNNLLDDKDVVYFNINENRSKEIDINPTMTVEEIKNKIQKWVNAFFQANTRCYISLIPYFFGGCQVMKQDGKGWKKGKIIIRFEFIPDEPDPEEETETKSLDDFRK